MKDQTSASTQSSRASRSPSKGERLFWTLADGLFDDPEVTRSTMMGYPCLRTKGAFFACVERTTGRLIVKLPASRVEELIKLGQAVAFAPSGRVFRQWAAFPMTNRKRWTTLLIEAREFVAS